MDFCRAAVLAAPTPRYVVASPGKSRSGETSMKRIIGVTSVLFSVTALLVFSCPLVLASIFGAVRGVVHDPQHRPIAGAHVMLKADNSDWSQSQESGENGEIAFTSVPIGSYTVTVTAPGFADMHLAALVRSDTAPVLHFELAVASAKETVLVSGIPVEATTDTVTPTTMVNRLDIQQTPGADRTNGMEMITDYVPSAYVTHDMLHMRGGHQVNWLIDGVPIPNTNIANNLGPQIDPKDIDYLEVQRGSYDADYGDRTYGVFNIVPRTVSSVIANANLVSHCRQFLPDQRPDQFRRPHAAVRLLRQLERKSKQYGLQTPIGQVVHDAVNGYGGFASFLFNPTPRTSSAGHFAAPRLLPDPPSTPTRIRPGIRLVRESRSAEQRAARNRTRACRLVNIFVRCSYVPAPTHDLRSRRSTTTTAEITCRDANDYPDRQHRKPGSTYAGGQGQLRPLTTKK